MFFPCKEKKKASKTENGASSGGMRWRTETSDVTACTSVDNNNSAPKMAICLWTIVDNSVENPIFQ